MRWQVTRFIKPFNLEHRHDVEHVLDMALISSFQAYDDVTQDSRSALGFACLL